jgi:hypothetical protein
MKEEKNQIISTETEIGSNFSVQYTEGNEVIWARGRKDGIPMGRTSTKFVHDGTLVKIRLALVDALSELDAQIQLSLDHSN